jgi:Flp pilus assembly protein TadG
MLLSRFWKNCQGGVAPMLGLVIIPLMGAVGAAIDFSRANAARAAFQGALDSTALALSKTAANDPDLSTTATNYFNALFSRGDTSGVTITASYSGDGGSKLVLSGTGTVSTDFLNLLGYPSIQIGAASTSTWGNTRLRIALVLDNTGSMANNGKLAALKTASHNLLNTLQSAAKKEGDVKVAIIPFDRMVNIGTGFKDEFWVDYTVKNIKKEQWNGCVIDRDQSNDVQDTPPVSTNYHTFFPAQQCGSLVTAMPLSTDWTALHTKVDQMAAAGNTNTTIGLAWGWHALTSNLPFTNAAAPAPDLDKVIVLLTDGENTQNRWTTSSSSIDARMSAACTNVKAANIKIYTVRVINGDATLLRNCATKPNMYYDVQQADQLNGVFSSIAQNLANLRIAK